MWGGDFRDPFRADVETELLKQRATAASRFRRLEVSDASDDWFEVYQVAPDLFVFYEPRHYEETLASLIVGRESAALIDTGCGIGNLRRAVEAVTDRPVTVVNTHTHLDHLGGNRLFADIAMFDHPISRLVAKNGASSEILQREIFAEGLVTPPWPEGFDSAGRALPPFEVRHWLADGDRIPLAGRELEVIHTPGEAPDHICLLDRSHRILFCGDILLHGPVWTHLEGGSLDELIASYEKLMSFSDAFDRLMPGHNEPWLDSHLLPEALAGARSVAAGRAEYREVGDPWGRQLRQYSFGRISFLTKS